MEIYVSMHAKVKDVLINNLESIGNTEAEMIFDPNSRWKAGSANVFYDNFLFAVPISEIIPKNLKENISGPEDLFRFLKSYNGSILDLPYFVHLDEELTMAYEKGELEDDTRNKNPKYFLDMARLENINPTEKLDVYAVEERQEGIEIVHHIWSNTSQLFNADFGLKTDGKVTITPLGMIPSAGIDTPRPVNDDFNK